MTIDTDDLAKWTEIVVEVNQSNWVEILLEIFENTIVDSLPHFRFSGDKEKIKKYGISLRFFSPSKKEINDIFHVIKSKELVHSLNPKQKKDDPLRNLSGWFDDVDAICVNMFSSIRNPLCVIIRSVFKDR